jgi:hypothetical protein
MMTRRGLVTAALIAASFVTVGCQEQAPIAAPLATGERGVTSIAVDDGYVYWSRVDGSVKKVSLDTGSVEILASMTGLSGNVTLDDTHVYFSLDATLCAVAKTGGAVQVMPQKANIQRITLDADNIYWSDDDETNNINAMPKVSMTAAATRTVQAAATTLASAENPIGVLASGGNLLFGSESSGQQPNDQNDVDQTTAGAFVNAVSTSGGTVNQLLSTTSNVLTMVSDSTHVFWAGAGAEGGIGVAALDGSSPQVLSTDNLAVNLASNATNLYWSNAVGQVQLVPVVGGAPQTLITGPAGTVSMTLDVGNVYWANSSDDGIYAMPLQTQPTPEE